MTIGVWPDAIVAGAGSTGSRLPLSESFLKKSMPGWMLSAEPPLASAARTTPLKPAPALVGSPLRATLPLYFASARSDDLRDGAERGVVADGHEAGVVVGPEAGGLLVAVRDVLPGGHLVRGVHVGVGEGDGRAQVEDVGLAAGAGQLLRGVDLVLAAGVRLVGLDLDPVLRGEVGDHLAVVRPVGRGGDQVDGALGLACGADGVDAAGTGGRGGLPVDRSRRRGVAGAAVAVPRSPERWWVRSWRRCRRRPRRDGGDRQRDEDPGFLRAQGLTPPEQCPGLPLGPDP